jgi:carbon-monoxide dehydrogenase small subunit
MGEKMQIELYVNEKLVRAEIEADMLLIDFLRKQGCYSVKRGCETGNCGACTVYLDEKPVLSCGILAARAAGHHVLTLEGMQEEAGIFADFLAAQGADQCGFCNPGYVMNAMAMLKENPDPTEEEIRSYMAGNLCRCSGYESQVRGIRSYIAYLKEKGAAK